MHPTTFDGIADFGHAALRLVGHEAERSAKLVALSSTDNYQRQRPDRCRKLRYRQIVSRQRLREIRFGRFRSAEGIGCHNGEGTEVVIKNPLDGMSRARNRAYNASGGRVVGPLLPCRALLEFADGGVHFDAMA